MLRYFFILTFRSWKRESGITLINLLGLSLGIASAILLYLFIKHEYSYEDMHAQRDNIHRLYVKVEGADGGQGPFMPPSAGPVLAGEIPQIKAFARIARNNTSIRYEEWQLNELEMLMVDSTFFDFFDFGILEGNPRQALTGSSSVILTKSLADKLFPGQDALNKPLDIGISRVDLSTGQMNQVSTRFIVAAIINDPPSNTHLQFELLAPVYAMDNVFFQMETHFFATYFMFHQPLTQDVYERITSRAQDIVYENFKKHSVQVHASLGLQNLKDIRFGEIMYGDFSPQGNKQTIWVFIILAFFILIIAIANFINLSTARSEKRLVEAGIRKVLGSNRLNLIMHYTGESVLITFAGVIIALFFIENVLPVFSGIMGQKVVLASMFSAQFAAFLLLFSLGVGILAGIWPAYHFSRHEPSQVLKGKFFSGGKQPWLRITLITFQFAISVFLIVAVWIVNDQIRYMHTDNRTYDPQKILVFRNISPGVKNSFTSVKQELLMLPQVSTVVANNGMPGHIGFGLSLRAKEHEPIQEFPAVCFETDTDFPELFGINLLDGQWLDGRLQTKDFEFVINQTAARRLGFDDPVGQEVVLHSFNGKIIGLVEDFHFESKHSPIRPLVFTRFLQDFQRIAIRVEGDNYAEVQNSIVSVLKNADENFVDEGIWMDQLMAEFYEAEEKTFKIISWASLLAIIIGLIGLTGLTNYLMQARSNEICIRKVLGAGYWQITGVLMGSMLKWVLLANLIAWPLAWYAASIWLENFAYRISISAHYFIVAGLASVMITVLVVVSQSYRQLMSNPVKGLKAE